MQPLRIFPLHAILRDAQTNAPKCACNKEGCKDVGKHPAVAWRYWGDAGEEPTVAEGGGCGIRTGDGLFVLDLDVKDGKDGVAALEQVLAGRELPDTVVVYTPSGGVHLYFEAPPDATGAPPWIGNSRGALGPGIDVRGDGGYVVGPGSPHRLGGVYHEEGAAIALAPPWLVDLVVSAGARKVAQVSTHTYLDPNSERGGWAVAWAKGYLANAEACVEGQGGSDVMFSVCCHLMRSALPLETLQGLIEAGQENGEGYNARCEPPWSAEEIAHKLSDADARMDEVRGLPSPGFFARMSGRVESPPGPRDDPGDPPPDPEHEYTYAAGMRSNGEARKASFGEIQCELFDNHAWDGVFAYDTFRARVIARNPPVRLDAEKPNGLSDIDVELVRGWLEYHDRKCNSTDVRNAIEVVARRRSFNPVQDYLRALEWDGLSRLDRVLPMYFETRDGPYERAIGPRWFMSLVARAMTPGCQSDCSLILEGEQGIGKTSAFRALMWDPTWYAESSAGVDSKDFFENLRGVWLMGFDELDSLTRGSLTRVKTVLTSVRDRYRASYGHFTQDYPRACGFCGSTNAEQYFNDPTGFRRLWPVKVLRPINAKKLIEDRESLWAEAYVRWYAGEPWHVNTPELRALCEREQEERLEVDPWEEAIAEWFNDPTKVHRDLDRKPAAGPLFTGAMKPYDASGGVTTAVVLERALGKLPGQWTNFDAQRVGKCLHRLGMHRVRRRNNEIIEWRYVLILGSQADPSLIADPGIAPSARSQYGNN